MKPCLKIRIIRRAGKQTRWWRAGIGCISPVLSPMVGEEKRERRGRRAGRALSMLGKLSCSPSFKNNIAFICFV